MTSEPPDTSTSTPGGSTAQSGIWGVVLGLLTGIATQYFGRIFDLSLQGGYITTKDYCLFGISIFLIGVIVASFIFYLRQKKMKELDIYGPLPGQSYWPTRKEIAIFAAVLIGSILLVFLLAPILDPPFQITAPSDGELVNYSTSVSGTGVPSDRNVMLSIIVRPEGYDDIVAKTWSPLNGGQWDSPAIQIGEWGDQSRGYPYSIRAQLDVNGKLYFTNWVRVVRD